MNVRSRWGTFAAVAAVLTVGLTAQADAHAVRKVAHQIAGSSIKKHSMPANRIVPNSVTSAQIDESKLKLPPLAWHKLTLANGWSALLGDRTPAYAVDAQGIVHLRGAMCCGTTNQAFSLPSRARPAKNTYLLAFSNGGYAAELAILPTGKVYVYSGGGAPPTSTTNLTSLDGVTFAAS